MKKKFWITFLIAIVGFSILFIGVGSHVSNRDILASLEDTEGQDMDEDLKGENEIMVLLMGIDAKNGVDKVKQKEIKEGQYMSTGYRSDTMMLCKYNFETGKLDLLSIPRDSRVNIRGRQSQEKLNHAYSYGGPYLSMKTVSDMLNVDLKYYVTTDYLAVKETVNDIGGVDIDVPMDMKYSDPADVPPLNIDIKKGYQNLDGQTAVEFLRFRSSEGDISRVHTQQLFMKEFIKQALQPKNILKLPKMAKTYYDYVDTNIPLGTILRGVSSANKLDIDNFNIETLPGDGDYIEGVSYYIYDEVGSREIVNEIFGGFLLSQ